MRLVVVEIAPAAAVAVGQMERTRANSRDEVGMVVEGVEQECLFGQMLLRLPESLQKKLVKTSCCSSDFVVVVVVGNFAVSMKHSICLQRRQLEQRRLVKEDVVEVE